ncbi:hypothetical protein MASR1M32_39910 [Rhodobacter sp.]
MVGSSSLRRRAQLALRRPDLKLVEFRGNVQTRMRKLEEGVADATFLAMAGLTRLGMADVARSAIAPEEMLPACAQGAIGVERRQADDRVAALLAPIHHGPTGLRLAAERAFLTRLDGSCETPIAGLAVLEGDRLWLRGEILRPDGTDAVGASRAGRRARGRRWVLRWRMICCAAPARGSLASPWPIPIWNGRSRPRWRRRRPGCSPRTCRTDGGSG